MKNISLEKIAIQRALLGEVTSNLRRVIFSIDESELSIRFYFDGVITELDEETVSSVGKKVYFDYQSTRRILVKALREDYPHPIKDHGFSVYERKENYFSENHEQSI